MWEVETTMEEFPTFDCNIDISILANMGGDIPGWEHSIRELAEQAGETLS